MRRYGGADRPCISSLEENNHGVLCNIFLAQLEDMYFENTGTTGVTISHVFPVPPRVFILQLQLLMKLKYP